MKREQMKTVSRCWTNDNTTKCHIVHKPAIWCKCNYSCLMSSVWMLYLFINQCKAVEFSISGLNMFRLQKQDIRWSCYQRRSLYLFILCFLSLLSIVFHTAIFHLIKMHREGSYWFYQYKSTGGLLRHRHHYSEASQYSRVLCTLFLEHNWLFWSPAQIVLYEGLLCDISTWLNYLHHLLFDNVFIYSFIQSNLFMSKNNAFADEYIDILGQQNWRYHFLTPYSQLLIHFVAVKENYFKYNT